MNPFPSYRILAGTHDANGTALRRGDVVIMQDGIAAGKSFEIADIWRDKDGVMLGFTLHREMGWASVAPNQVVKKE